MPPSISTSIWSPTASAIGFTIRIVAGVPSRLLPPWLDTEIAVTPASTARRASSTRHTPLSMNGAAARAAPTARASTRRPPTTAAAWSSTRSRRRRTSAPRHRAAPGSGAVRSGICPACANCRAQRGRAPTCGAIRTIVFRSTFSGISGLPQSRPIENDQSSVAINPTAPACLARCIRWIIMSRSPVQYIWKSVCGLAATTSSTDLEAKLDNPITVPRAAAARATATSPSGCTACTPVGEMITGSEMSWPSTARRHRPLAPGAPPRAGRSRSRGTPPRCPRSSARAPSPPPARRTPARAAACCARRCATATDSNHGFCFHGFANQVGFGMPLILCVRPRRGHLSGRTGSGGRMDGSAKGCSGAS